MKPFLLIQSRPEDEASDNEYEAFLTFSGLKKEDLKRFRVEQSPLPKINLDEFSGIIVGGGPFNASDPDDKKSMAQKRAEQELFGLLDEIIANDFPFLGACYGIGLIGTHQGAVIDRQYSESVGPTHISLTSEGRKDSLLEGLSEQFEAFVGHKEACSLLPPHAVHLASSPDCPIQMFRINKNVYATQFHPELDSYGLETRIKIYKHAGYFPPEEADSLIAAGHAAAVTEPVKILQNFITRYSQAN